VSIDVSLKSSISVLAGVHQDKVNLMSVPSIHNCEGEKVPDGGPLDYWAVGFPVMDVLDPLASMKGETPYLAAIYLSSVNPVLVLHGPHQREDGSFLRDLRTRDQFPVFQVFEMLMLLLHCLNKFCLIGRSEGFWRQQRDWAMPSFIVS
jgi:hypothetical protein